MNARKLWSRLRITVGSIAMLVDALDPMEGSPAIRQKMKEPDYEK